MVYQNGAQPLITETFGIETVPGDFTTFVPTDPTTVTFTIRDPDNTVTAYIFGIDAEVTNPSVGVYVFDHGPYLLAGDWFYRVEGTGVVCAIVEGELTILPSSVLTPIVSEPVNGPCQSWCDPQDVIECSNIELSSDLSVLEDACASASGVLFELSGRQYNGRCTQTRRPCADGCSWPSWLFPGLSPGAPQVPVGWPGWGWWGTGWGFGAAGCNSCGCTPLCSALLPGYPVTSITEVQIDGVVLNPDEYRLDEWRWLTRMADADGSPQCWPSCQRLDRPDGDDETWQVTYVYGVVPPVTGRRAAAQLAGEIYKACVGDDCKLPVGTVQVTRSGISRVQAPYLAWGRIGGRWATGLTLVDMFLSARNPAGLKRRPVTWSPGGPKYARKVGV